MKINTPEKIYVHIKDKPCEITFSEVIEKECSNIEYIRADAFIEKVCERLEPILKNYAGYYVGNDILRNFKNDIMKEIYEYNR